MKYHVWIWGQKEKTIEIIDVPLRIFNGLKEKTPSPMYVKDTACKSGIFSWTDYTKLRIKKL